MHKAGGVQEARAREVNLVLVPAAAHLVFVVPEDVGGWLRAELDEAGQVDGAAHVHVQVGTTQDARRRHYAHTVEVRFKSRRLYTLGQCRVLAQRVHVQGHIMLAVSDSTAAQ